MQVLKEDIRGRILAVAEQRFGQQGYSKTSMREIAGAVGVGVGNIYNYFRNKDELFCEVVRPVLHAMEAMLQEHHGIRGEDVMTMRSEKYLQSLYRRIRFAHRNASQPAGDPVVPCPRLFAGTFSRKLHRPFDRAGQGMVRRHEEEVPEYKYGCVRFYHSPAYGVDVHAVRGAVDARGPQTGNGIHSARLYSV